MVDSEYSPGNHKSSKISIGAIIKNTEMLKFVPDYLKTKKMCKHAVKKLLFVIRHIPDRYKTHGGTLKSVPNCYKNKKNV